MKITLKDGQVETFQFGNLQFVHSHNGVHLIQKQNGKEWITIGSIVNGTLKAVGSEFIGTYFHTEEKGGCPV